MILSIALAAAEPRLPTDYWAERGLRASARIALAAKRDEAVRALFAATGVPWPPSQMLWRAYKQEGELEVWAGSPLTLVATWGICTASGGLGPKRQQGDLQVPEGYYVLDIYNSLSNYHLSMRVNYPNVSDKVLGAKGNLGGDIYIHGSCASIGCLAMGDEGIEELWQIAQSMRSREKTVHVHMLPARDIAALIASGVSPEHRDFWQNLAEGDAIFRGEKRIPTVSVASDGRYAFR